MNRRDFLKMLAVIPAVAAIPANALVIEQIAETLPAVDPIPVVTSCDPDPLSPFQIYINDVLIHFREMNLDSRQDFIRVTRESNPMVELRPGLRHNTLRLTSEDDGRLFDLRRIFMEERDVSVRFLVAGLEQEFRGLGIITGLEYMQHPAMLPLFHLDLELFDLHIWYPPGARNARQY